MDSVGDRVVCDERLVVGVTVDVLDDACVRMLVAGEEGVDAGVTAGVLEADSCDTDEVEEAGVQGVREPLYEDWR